MDDPNFTAKLYSARLLSSYLKEYVESRSPATRTEKATRFLDQVIKPSMTSFDKLLHVMEDSEYQHVKELAEKIRASLRNTSSSNYGNYHTKGMQLNGHNNSYNKIALAIDITRQKYMKTKYGYTTKMTHKIQLY